MKWKGGVPITQPLHNNGKDDVTIKSLKNQCKRLKINYRVTRLRLKL